MLSGGHMSRTLTILLGGDILIALFATHLGFLVRFGNPGVLPSLSMDPVKVLPFAGVLLLTGYVSELYSADKEFEHREALMRICVSVFLAFLLLSALYYMIPQVSIGRGLLALSLLTFGVVQFLWHYRFPLLLKAPGIARRVLILGTGPLAREMADLSAGSKNRYVFAGYVMNETDPRAVPGDEVVGKIGDLAETARRLKVNKIVIALTERRGVLPMKDILACKMRGINVVDAMTFYETITGKLKIEEINPSWFVFSNGFRLTPLMKVVKRMLDVVLASVGLMLFLPILPLVALAIRLESPGPVLFRQIRCGESEKPFHVYKFRSMRNDAETKSGAVWAQKNDPRVTRVGKFIRKVRVDEVPQLFNVLKGEMSFVGPRPERPEFVERLKETIPYYSNRHFVKPGVTGWAQVRYPYGASESDALEKLRYDLYYIKNYSPVLDLAIIMETFKVVIFGRGAQ